MRHTPSGPPALPQRETRSLASLSTLRNTQASPRVLRCSVSPCLLLAVAVVGSCLVATLNAQQTPQATFRTTTRLVVQPVTVKDRDGKPVEGLTARDFTITEDGAPQDIAFVEFQRLEPEPTQAPAPTRPTVVPPAP